MNPTSADALRLADAQRGDAAVAKPERPEDLPHVPNAAHPGSRRRRTLTLLAAAILAPLAAAALWPVTFASREELFEIPKGTWARRMDGDKLEILPSTIHLVVGVHDTLTLKNSDDVPQIFGPTLLMPGQTFRLPFATASENYFACTAHASGQLVVSVEAEPVWPWSRLGFRIRRLLRRLSEA